MPGTEEERTRHTPPRARRLSWPAALAGGLLAGLGLAFAWEFGRVMIGRNEHAVIPGQVYRCAQLTANQLERKIRRHGIRTVVNLRGCNPLVPWYVEEARA